MQTSSTDAPNGAPVPAGKGGAQRAASAAGREAFVAAMAARKADAPDAAEVKPAPAPDAEPDSLDEGEGAEAGAEEGAPPAIEAKPKEDPPDADATRRLVAAQKEERAKRERAAREARERADRDAAIAKERAELDAARKEMEAERKALADLKRLRERAKADPDAALELLGIDGDYDTLARLAYSQTEAGQKDPKAKEYAARLLRERAARGEVGGVKNEVTELRDLVAKQNERLEQMAQQLQHGHNDREAANEYLNNVEESLTADDHPAVFHALSAARATASNKALPIADRKEAQQAVKDLRNEFLAAAQELYKRDGIEPDHADVAAEVERQRAAMMRRWGVDPKALAQPAPTKKPASPPPRALASGGGAPTSPPRKLTPEELRGQFMRDKAAGKVPE